MSRRRSAVTPMGRPACAPVFAALGDETRLGLVGKLCSGEPLSISELSRGSRLTRQAITKHLRILENVRLVRGARRGRRTLFQFTPEPVEDARGYLEGVSYQWDKALARLRSFVESNAPDKASKAERCGMAPG